MAEIVEIVSNEFYEPSGETVTYGRCSYCREIVFYQFSSGFPEKCPKCNVDLEVSPKELDWITNKSKKPI